MFLDAIFLGEYILLTSDQFIIKRVNKNPKLKMNVFPHLVRVNYI